MIESWEVIAVGEKEVDTSVNGPTRRALHRWFGFPLDGSYVLMESALYRRGDQWMADLDLTHANRNTRERQWTSLDQAYHTETGPVASIEAAFTGLYTEARVDRLPLELSADAIAACRVDLVTQP